MTLVCCAVGASGKPRETVAFGEKDAIIVADVAGLDKDATVWFRGAKEGRTLFSGSVAVLEKAPLRLPVSMPELKTGVVLPLELTLRLGDDKGSTLFDGRLWTFSALPVAPGANPVAPRKLYLYDPDGQTEVAFRELGLAFEQVFRLELVPELRDAVLVIGEGLSLNAERGLLEALEASVQQGNDVLLLASDQGTLRLPTWHRLVAGDVGDVFTQPEPRGNANRPDIALLTRADTGHLFQLVGLREGVAFDVVRTEGVRAIGWDGAGNAGRFRACGFPIITRWNTNTAARWLLVELLEHFSKKGT